MFFSQKSIIVTPNERQALALWEEDSQRQQQRGKKAWESLPVCSWPDFLQALWEEYWLAGLYADTPCNLMNEWQERFLWMDVLSQSELGGGLLNLPAAAKLAAEAWKLCNSYRLGPELFAEGSYWPHDTQVFLQWVQDFQARCRSHNWLESSRLDQALVERIENGHLPTSSLPTEVQFCGFAEWTPAQSNLLRALRQNGVSVLEQDSAQPAELGQWRQVSAVDSREEIYSAAYWLRAKLENSTSKTTRVGLVIPNLADRREEVSRILTEVFQPSQLTRSASADAQVHDISAGLPFSRWPLISAALSLLGLRQSVHTIEDWKVLLNSPYVGGAEDESSSRALLWNHLCRQGRFRVERSRMVQLCSQRSAEGLQQPYTCNKLSERLAAVDILLKDCPKEQLPSEWTTHFSEVLEAHGWPGQRQLDSSEYQTLARWKSMLSQLGSLDRLIGRVTAGRALAIFRRMADETVYQPKVSSGQVQVMGTLEAVGLHFDHLWLAGFHDGVWPQPARPNPYLPYSLQRQHGVAHSTPERELEFSRRITKQLLKASPEGIVSYPRNLDEQSIRPSPLLADLPQQASSELGLEKRYRVHEIYLASKTEHTLFDPGPPSLSEVGDTRGGTALFKDQAICPFRAFTHHRLRVRPLEVVKEGLDGAQRGSLLHDALDMLWTRVRTLQNWRGFSAENRAKILAQSAQTAVSRLQRKRPDVLRGVMVSLEIQRVENLLREWMEVEDQREPFEVLATEEKVVLEFAALRIRATIDRIDRLSDGSLAVIDYKTGSAEVRDWLGERPKEPQLPLYCVAHPERVDTICFAKVRTGKMAFQGLSHQDEIIPGVQGSEYAADGTTSWPARRIEWRERLENIAAEFRRGESRVTPLEGNLSCRYCGLQPLCRVDEKESLS